jgi:hypothetical protein
MISNMRPDIYVLTHIWGEAYFLRGIDSDLPMFLRCHAIADHPFAYAWSALRLPFPGNSRYSADEGFPAPRLSPQAWPGGMHETWDLDDLQASIKALRGTRSQS